MRLTLGWKKRCSSTSSVESEMPVASKTSAPTRSSGESLACFAPMSSSTRSSCSLSRPPGAPPSSTGPETTADPGA